jgi:hypothetical protein
MLGNRRPVSFTNTDMMLNQNAPTTMCRRPVDRRGNEAGDANVTGREARVGAPT